MAVNSAKHAECVQQKRGHDIRCLYSFHWERNRQGESHLFQVPFPAGSKDKDSSCTAHDQATERVLIGEDCVGLSLITDGDFIRILLLKSEFR